MLTVFNNPVFNMSTLSTLPWFNVLDYGVVGNGSTDDTSAFQALLDSVGNYATVYIPPGKTVVVTGLTMTDRKGICFCGGGGVVGPQSSSAYPSAPAIIYGGSAGGTIFDLSGCCDMIWENLVIDGAGLADFGVKYHQELTGGEVTDVTFSHVLVHANVAGAGRQNWIGIDYGGTGTENNCEHLQVINGSGLSGGNGADSIGVRIGHSNSLLNIVDGCAINYCKWGVAMRNSGIVKVTRNLFTGNQVDIAGVHGEPIEVAFNRTELSKQFYSGSAPIFLHENVYGSPATEPAACIIDILSGSACVSINNYHANYSQAAFNNIGSCYLISMGNTYPAADWSAGLIVSMGTFSKYMSIGDMTYGHSVTDVLPTP